MSPLGGFCFVLNEVYSRLGPGFNTADIKPLTLILSPTRRGVEEIT